MLLCLPPKLNHQKQRNTRLVMASRQNETKEGVDMIAFSMFVEPHRDFILSSRPKEI
jgi:hypothetical protein